MILSVLPLGARKEKGQGDGPDQGPKGGAGSMDQQQQQVAWECSLSCVPLRAGCSQAKTTAADFTD